MVRQIIHIDETKCNGCGICAKACHEGAIDIVNGKAKLVREHFCDGFGDCLPGCPQNAITFETREAPEYDERAVKLAKDIKKSLNEAKEHPSAGGCPGSRIVAINHRGEETKNASEAFSKTESRLSNWPVQIKLAPISAPYFENAELLVAADCTAYSYAAFHEDFIKGRVTLIGCPKLDSVNYSEKLGEIVRNNDILSVTLVRMEVPCCGGLERAMEQAIDVSGKDIPLRVITVGIDGTIL